MEGRSRYLDRHIPVAEAPAPVVVLVGSGWTRPPPALTAPPPRSQRVRRRPAPVPERGHLRAEPALRLPAWLHRRALRAAPLRPRRRRGRPGLRPRAGGCPTPRHPARLPAAAGAGCPPGLLSPAEGTPGRVGASPRALSRPAPFARRARGPPGAGVRGLAVRRVRPELLPGATQQSPPAPSPLPQWHLPPPLHGSGGCCGVLAPAACDFGLSFSFILPTAPFLLFFFFFAGSETEGGEKRCSPHTLRFCLLPHTRLLQTPPTPVPGSPPASGPKVQLPTTLVADDSLFYSWFSFATHQTLGLSRGLGTKELTVWGQGVRTEGWEGRTLPFVENYFCLY